MCKSRQFLVLTVTACFMAMVTISCALAAGNDFQVLMANGRKLMEKKDYSGARAYFQKADHLCTENSSSTPEQKASAARNLFWTGLVTATLKEKILTLGVDQGEVFYTAALQTVPADAKDAYSYFARGGLYYSADDKKTAIDELTHGLQMKPDETIAYVLRANIYKELGNKQAEEADLAKAKQLGWEQ